MKFAFKVSRGNGIYGITNGILKKNVLATYTHIHTAVFPCGQKAFLARHAITEKNEYFFGYTKRTIDNTNNVI